MGDSLSEEGATDAHIIILEGFSTSGSGFAGGKTGEFIGAQVELAEGLHGEAFLLAQVEGGALGVFVVVGSVAGKVEEGSVGGFQVLGDGFVGGLGVGQRESMGDAASNVC
ncbi:hypothetical protein BI308_21975 [Roseofilum reptotaenium AO1-A]|uniref:Uncharacterized protein n=1 Tax=Roseofilum reptotaenium AO1-A TaxID=1925591 RepID=A0A1L9QL67_9CYAN|nr:hypothetical protein BI308_21975 [Roseofilum reptotaenium AO1-A]